VNTHPGPLNKPSFDSEKNQLYFAEFQFLRLRTFLLVEFTNNFTSVTVAVVTVARLVLVQGQREYLNVGARFKWYL
jgi:hypothetical protein